MIEIKRKGVIEAVLVSTVLLVLSGVAGADPVRIKGVINGRSGATLSVQSADSGKVTVLLTPSTKVDEMESILVTGHLAPTALIPGLTVTVEGSYDSQKQLVADKVLFQGSDLKAAQDIQAGLAPVQQQVQQEQKEIEAQQKASAEHAAEIAANKAAIAEANKRFGELGDYNILGEVTVLFGNGQTAIEPQYKPQLVKLAQQAKGVKGYVISVQGYASKVGSAALNQKLSAERAANVTAFMEQEGKIPLTNMLAPGAMGTSKQVAPDASTEGQAENRRVVVRILQNKAIAGVD
jgi:outer membrane protein OmpA-like peptidoglycan-associated protein